MVVPRGGGGLSCERGTPVALSHPGQRSASVQGYLEPKKTHRPRTVWSVSGVASVLNFEVLRVSGCEFGHRVLRFRVEGFRFRVESLGVNLRAGVNRNVQKRKWSFPPL